MVAGYIWPEYFSSKGTQVTDFCLMASFLDVLFLSMAPLLFSLKVLHGQDVGITDFMKPIVFLGQPCLEDNLKCLK